MRALSGRAGGEGGLGRRRVCGDRAGACVCAEGWVGATCGEGPDVKSRVRLVGPPDTLREFERTDPGEAWLTPRVITWQRTFIHKLLPTLRSGNVFAS